MSFPVIAAGLLVFLAAVSCLPRDGGSEDTGAAGLTVVADDPADSVRSLDPDQLARRIYVEQQVVAMNQTLLERLEAPEPIYATERSALPANKLEIAAYRADFKAYSAELAAAKNNLMVLQRVKEERLAELQLQSQR
jgi:hypothetical protein